MSRERADVGPLRSNLYYDMKISGHPSDQEDRSLTQQDYLSRWKGPHKNIYGCAVALVVVLLQMVTHSAFTQVDVLRIRRPVIVHFFSKSNECCMKFRVSKRLPLVAGGHRRKGAV